MYSWLLNYIKLNLLQSSILISGAPLKVKFQSSLLCPVSENSTSQILIFTYLKNEIYQYFNSSKIPFQLSSMLRINAVQLLLASDVCTRTLHIIRGLKWYTQSLELLYLITKSWSYSQSQKEAYHRIPGEHPPSSLILEINELEAMIDTQDYTSPCFS